MKNIKILILGESGMVGNTVFKYLKSINQKNVFATNRKEFSVGNFEKDFKLIQKKLGKIDYVINCIGLKNPNSTKKRFNEVNGEFPNKLAKTLNKNGTKLIHISTDAVFNPKKGIVKESDHPDPIDSYGISKLKGEANLTNTIIIRTSLVGFNKKNEGIFEWVKNSKQNIQGFTNQIWSGCTTLQFAKLCEHIIREGNFEQLRKKSYVYHFAPLNLITKYMLVRTIAKLTNPDIKVNKSKSPKEISRFLASKYFDKKFLKPYTTNLNKAILELLKFEKNEKI
jgi:dTDP-4-dehydrorhamnose reductase